MRACISITAVYSIYVPHHFCPQQEAAILSGRQLIDGVLCCSGNFANQAGRRGQSASHTQGHQAGLQPLPHQQLRGSVRLCHDMSLWLGTCLWRLTSSQFEVSRGPHCMCVCVRVTITNRKKHLHIQYFSLGHFGLGNSCAYCKLTQQMKRTCLFSTSHLHVAKEKKKKRQIKIVLSACSERCHDLLEVLGLVWTSKRDPCHPWRSLAGRTAALPLLPPLDDQSQTIHWGGGGHILISYPF